MVDLKLTEPVIRDLIALDAKALGLTYGEALDRVRSGKAGSGVIWNDLCGLVRMLEAV